METRRPLPGVLAVVFLGVWPFMAGEYDVPFALGALLWLGVFLAVVWFLLRPLGYLPRRPV